MPDQPAESFQIITGRNPVIEVLRSGGHIERLVLLTGVKGYGIDEIRRLAARNGLKIEELPRNAFQDLARTENTQGVIAFVARHQLPDVDDLLAGLKHQDRPGFLLCLDQIEDPQNLGALIRTAECAGAHGVILTKHHTAPVSQATIKASAGATSHIPIGEATNLVQTLKGLKKESYWIVGLDSSGPKDYTEMDYSTPVALVVGNEGKGIRRLVREECDFLVRIPLHGKIQSLNASVAGALVMYEVARQRHPVQKK